MGNRKKLVVTVADFPAFFDFDPSSPSFRCLYPVRRSEDRMRSNSRSKNGSQPKSDSPLCRIRAPSDNFASMQKRIVNSSTDICELLKEYAISCCCTRWHQDWLRGSDLLIELCENWEDQINEHMGKDKTSTAAASMLKENKKTVVKVEEVHSPTSESDDASNTHHKAAVPVHKLQDGFKTATDKPVIERRVTRSQAQLKTSRLIKTNIERPGKLNDFRPYKNPPKATVQTELQIDLNMKGRGQGTINGWVYMFTRDGTEGFVKIGCTKDVDKRMAKVERDCKYKPKVQHKVEVPHMYRVEKLIHRQFNKFWRREWNCPGFPVCHTKHQEWFEVSIHRAIQVMNSWASWINAAKPYNVISGKLEDKWIVYLNGLGKDQSVTGEMMLNELHRMKAAECTVPTMIVQSAVAIEKEKIEKEEMEDSTAASAASPEFRNSAPIQFILPQPKTPPSIRKRTVLHQLPPSPPETPPKNIVLYNSKTVNPSVKAEKEKEEEEPTQIQNIIPQTELDRVDTRLTDMRIAAGLTPPRSPPPLIANPVMTIYDGDREEYEEYEDDASDFNSPSKPLNTNVVALALKMQAQPQQMMAVLA